MDSRHGRHLPLPLVLKGRVSTFSCFTRRVRRAQCYSRTPGKYLATLHTLKHKISLVWLMQPCKPAWRIWQKSMVHFVPCNHKAIDTGIKGKAAASAPVHWQCFLLLQLTREEASGQERHLAALTFLNKLFSELCSQVQACMQNASGSQANSCYINLPAPGSASIK